MWALGPLRPNYILKSRGLLVPAKRPNSSKIENWPYLELPVLKKTLTHLVVTR